MRSHSDVEAYLLRMSRPFEDAGTGTYVLKIDQVAVALKIDPPLVIARVDIGNVPEKGREALYAALLELNATKLVHAAYGIDNGRIVLSAALELENLDYNELDAVIAEIDLALSQQLPKVRALASAST